MEPMSEREKHLIEALLHLLLYLGGGGEESIVVKKAKELVFVSGGNPKNDFSNKILGG